MMTEWRRARKRPVVVEYREPSVEDSQGFLKGVAEKLETGHGVAYAVKGEDFVIRDEVGEYPIRKDVFYKNYKVLEDEAT